MMTIMDDPLVRSSQVVHTCILIVVDSKKVKYVLHLPSGASSKQSYLYEGWSPLKSPTWNFETVVPCNYFLDIYFCFVVA